MKVSSQATKILAKAGLHNAELSERALSGDHQIFLFRPDQYLYFQSAKKFGKDLTKRKK